MRLFALALIPLVAACATPREACIASVNNQSRTLDRLVLETRANIERGFALETRQEVREVMKPCEIEQPDGTVIRTTCERVDVKDKRVPVAIDLNAEKRKLASLEERQRQVRSNAQAAIQQCVAANPE